ncbi:MAG: acyltransferase [Deltaproteobacteria bacterium]|nr:acyltransferase [Deltaproteobacteria bacterium]
MLRFLPDFILGSLGFLLLGLNTFFWVPLLYSVAFLKRLIKAESFRNFCTKISIWIGKGWIDGNRAIIRLTTKIDWDVTGLEKLPDKKSWVLIFSNHRSWVDIFVLQALFNHRLPFLKFFLKQELRTVPLMGLAWWALDFPYMKRYSKAVLAKHPELAGKDLETAREACRNFKKAPVSVINFLEGTRFSPEKHMQKNSPYRNLLPPKAGGVAVVVEEMRDYLAGIVDVTIVYSPDRVTFWDLFSGRIKRIIVNVDFFRVPDEISVGDYANDPEFAEKFRQWLNMLWGKKDMIIDSIKPHHC